MAKLSDSTRKQLRAIARKQAEKIAKEFEEKMSNHRLLDDHSFIAFSNSLVFI